MCGDSARRTARRSTRRGRRQSIPPRLLVRRHELQDQLWAATRGGQEIIRSRTLCIRLGLGGRGKEKKVPGGGERKRRRERARGMFDCGEGGYGRQGRSVTVS